MVRTMSKTLYRQCKLVREGNYHQTTWLPERYAIIGETLKLKTNDGWEDGWRVVSVFGDAGVSDPPDAYMEFRRHRKRTGDHD